MRIELLNLFTLLTLLLFIIAISVMGAFVYSKIKPASLPAKIFNNTPQGIWFSPRHYDFQDNGESFDEHQTKMYEYLSGHVAAQPGYTATELIKLNQPFFLKANEGANARACKRAQAAAATAAATAATATAVSSSASPSTAPHTGPTAALLVHGLYSSPNLMLDFAKRLQQNCISAQGILLPGHGTQPSDLAYIDKHVILDQMRKRTEAFIKDTPKAKRVLVGHSFGGLLSTMMAEEYKDSIHGLILIAPAFFISKNAPRHTKLAENFLTYIPNNDFGRLSPTHYFTQSVHAARVLFDVLNKLTAIKATTTIQTPTKLIISEDDEVTEYRGVISYARKLLPNLEVSINTKRPDYMRRKYGSNAHYLLSAAPEKKVVSMSHQGYLVRPNNPIYAEGGPMSCIDARNFSCDAPPSNRVWGGLANISSHAVISKLTTNPYFERDADHLVDFITNINLPK